MSDINTGIKTLEFKIHFSDSQLAKVERFLLISRQIWNHGLGLLVEHETFIRPYKSVNEDGKTAWNAAPCCPLPWKYRRIDPKGDWVKGNIAPFCPILDSRRPYRMACPIPQAYREPKLGLSLISKYTLQYYFAQKNHPHWKELSEIGAWYVRGVCDALNTAWTQYRTGKRGKPRFKSVRDGYTSLGYGDAKKLTLQPADGPTLNQQPRDAWISIPKIGTLKVKYLWHDWGNLPISVLRIVRKPDEWYLHLTGVVPISLPKLSTVTVGLCPVGQEGILAVDDQGRHYSVTSEEQRLLERRERLQQRAARQRRALQTAQAQGQSVKGTNLAATERKIARISQLLALRRKNEQYKIAAFMAQRAQSVALITPNSSLIPHPAPKPKPGTFPVEFSPNGAENISKFNKLKSTTAMGQFVSLLKSKVVEKGHNFQEVGKVKLKKSKQLNYQGLAKAIKPPLK